MSTHGDVAESLRRLFVVVVAVGAASCGGADGLATTPSPVEPLRPGCAGQAGKVFDGPIAVRDEKNGGPATATRPGEASGTLCLAIEVLPGRAVRVTGSMVVDGETQAVPTLLETQDGNGFVNGGRDYGETRSAWLFRRSCGETEMHRLVFAFGEATVEASDGLWVTESGTSTGCGDYSIDARLHVPD